MHTRQKLKNANPRDTHIKKYQITYPEALDMVEQERLSQTEHNCERYPGPAIGSGCVVEEVMRQIERDYWLNECGHKWSVDRVRALVEALGNNKEWQLAMLEEVVKQITEGERPRMAALRLHQNCMLSNPEEYRFTENTTCG